MKIKERFEIETSIKPAIHNLLHFFRTNILNIVAVVVTTLSSILFFSFSCYSSSKSQIEFVALSAANIAKDNSYQKVHFASKLHYYEDGSFSDNSKNNSDVFTNAHQAANRSFLRYSSAAFLTRNNFYNIPIEPNSDSIQYTLFDYTFLNSSFSLMNITPSTNSEIIKQYSTAKYVDGELVNNYSAQKKRMETIDLFLLSVNEKQSQGYPLFLPDYVAEKIVEENDDIKSIEDCVGLAGNIVVSGVMSDVYIKNIIVTSAKKGDPHNINDCDFTDGNVNFAKFLKKLYGNYSLMFFSPMYSQNRCLTCADFDSEYFKIESYLSNELVSLYSEKTESSLFSFEKEEDLFVLKENEYLSSTMTATLEKRLQNGNFSLFDGNVFALALASILFLVSLSLLYLFFYSNRFCKKRPSWYILLISIVPIVVVGVFALLFLFFFSLKYVFVGYYFSALAIPMLIIFSAQIIFSLVFLFVWRARFNE